MNSTGQLLHAFDDGTGWTSWIPLASAGVLDPTHHPGTTESNGAYRLVAFGRSTTGALVHIFYDKGYGAWNDWIPLSGPSSVASGIGAL